MARERAVAVVVRRQDGLLLTVQRPDEPGEELPGVWGLPATTLREGEAPADGIRRLGREKLGVALTAVALLGEGEQERDGYTLHMTVHEASMTGEPSLLRAFGTSYDALDWLPAASLKEAAGRGSLCCQVYLRGAAATSD